MQNEKLKNILKMILTTKAPCLIIIQGLPGSGKTTLAKEISSQFNIPYFEADQYFEDKDGNYNFNPKYLHSAHISCQARTFSRLKAGHSCICSNTFLADKEFKAYFLAAKQYNVKVFVIKMTTQYGSIHDIPKETMQRMKNRFNTCTIKPDFEYA